MLQRRKLEMRASCRLRFIRDIAAARHFSASHFRESGRLLGLISASSFYGVFSSTRLAREAFTATSDRRTSDALSTINYHDLFPGNVVAQRLDLSRSSPTVKDTWRLVPSTLVLARICIKRNRLPPCWPSTCLCVQACPSCSVFSLCRSASSLFVSSFFILFSGV